MKRARLLLVAPCRCSPRLAFAIAQERADREPIKIGFMVPLSGANAQNGRDILNGFLMLLEEIGYQAGGRRIELIVEDDEGIPAVGLTKARKLVERDQVHMMAGTLLSSTGYALAPYIDSMQIPMVYPVVSARRPDAAAAQQVDRPHRLDQQPAESCLRRVRVPHVEAAAGRDDRARLCVRMGIGRRLRADVRGPGRPITQKIWVPVSVHDFAPYLAQMSRDVDAVYALFLGRDGAAVHAAVPGVRAQGARAADRRRDDDRRARAAGMGDEAIGVITALHYSGALDTPANRKFAAAYRARFKRVPSYYSESMYTGGKWLVAAIEARERQRRGLGGVLLDAFRRVEADRSAARAGAPRRVRQPDREHLHPQASSA